MPIWLIWVIVVAAALLLIWSAICLIALIAARREGRGTWERHANLLAIAEVHNQGEHLVLHGSLEAGLVLIERAHELERNNGEDVCSCTWLKRRQERAAEA